MKFLAGWIAGIATAWAALAIWQRLPEFPDLDAADCPTGYVLSASGNCVPDLDSPRRGDRRPGYDDSVARSGWIAPSEALLIGSTLDDVSRG